MYRKLQKGEDYEYRFKRMLMQTTKDNLCPKSLRAMIDTIRRDVVCVYANKRQEITLIE